MPNKWRARTSRGKKKNNKPRTNAERDQHRSQAALADREDKRQIRIEAKLAKKDAARAAAQAKADEVTARVIARRIDPPAAKWAAKPKRSLPQPLPLGTAATLRSNGRSTLMRSKAAPLASASPRGCFYNTATLEYVS